MELVVFIMGVLIGSVLACIGFKIINTIGVLRVDITERDRTPNLFLVLDKGIENICRRKYVILKVTIDDFISHK